MIMSKIKYMCNLKIKRNDVLLILILIFLSICLYIIFTYKSSGAKTNDVVAVITKDNDVVECIELNKLEEVRTIEVKGYCPVTILAEKGRIRFKESNCPDKICVNTGWISKVGQVAVCLPAGVIVKIEGHEKEFDSITG